MTSMPFEGEVRHDGRLYSFAIPKLAIPVCRNCGQKVFTEKVEEQIQAALRAHLHLLTPEEIRFELEQLEMTQKDAADQIGIAEETLSRWLNGVQIQSRAMDNLLRLFFTSQEVRASLATIAGQGIKSRC
ncbi:MAG TPA: helix-turn-helix domain-containing protein [Gemmataceae bacterium]|nr:helix-turn-helix domain-containing protein [Gemmataceae bacterium]